MEEAVEVEVEAEEEEESTLPVVALFSIKGEDEEGRKEPVACACLSSHNLQSAAAAFISLAFPTLPCASLSLATHSNRLICPATLVGCKAARKGGREEDVLSPPSRPRPGASP